MADLRPDLAALLRLLEQSAEQCSGVNAFLLAAAAHQVVEDLVHPDPFRLRQAAGLIGSGSARPAQIASAAARAAAATATPVVVGRRGRGIWPLREDLTGLVSRLAPTALGAPFEPAERAAAAAVARRALEAASRLPSSVTGSVARLPSAFRSFDQHPDDVQALAERFAEAETDIRRPLLVAGVRTSGSYLAPLAAAALRRVGFSDVRTMTLRPGRPLLPGERAAVRAGVGPGGLVLLTDDPPASGASLAGAARVLEAHGLGIDQLVLLLALFGDRSSVPDALARYRRVTLGRSEWSVERRLEAGAVQTELARLAPCPPVMVARRDGTANRGRGHVRAVYDVRWVDGRTSAVEVEGVGLGWFGEHELAVAEALRPWVASPIGVRDGLAYRECLPDEDRLARSGPAGNGDSGPSELPGAMARYVVARHRSLPVGRDASAELKGEQPVWEVASRIVSRPFRRAALPARALALDAVVRRLLAVDQPSIVDGNMAPDAWFRGPDGDVQKIDAATRDFSNLDLACYDPVWDLAGVGPGDDGPGPAARRAFEAVHGPVDEERWLLYTLTHLWDAERGARSTASDLRRARSRAVIRYLTATCWPDPALSPSGNGPLCALDLDGVLESDPLGFPAPTPCSVRALHALAGHGFRPVLATGRSLPEVQDRCGLYGFAGGVAEYGSVVYDHGRRATTDLRRPRASRALDRLRSVVDADPSLETDPAYVSSVRAWRRTSAGPRPLDAATVERLVRAANATDEVRFVQGESQTDAVDSAANKRAGLEALAGQLGAPLPPAFAVGDGVEDLPMLAWADLAFAPAHAREQLRDPSVTMLRRSYQAGLGDAVTHLLGHAPGGCPACETPRPTPRQRALLSMLDAGSDGGRSIPASVGRLAAARCSGRLR